MTKILLIINYCLFYSENNRNFTNIFHSLFQGNLNMFNNNRIIWDEYFFLNLCCKIRNKIDAFNFVSNHRHSHYSHS